MYLIKVIVVNNACFEYYASNMFEYGLQETKLT